MSRNHFLIYEFLLDLSIGKVIPHFEYTPLKNLKYGQENRKKNKLVSTGNLFSSVTKPTDRGKRFI